MTPLIFHAIDFSAREVGSGLAVSALIGTVVRLLSGALLDRGIRCSWPVRGTTLLAIAADLILLQADNYNSYLLGQLLLCLLYTSPSPRDVEESRMPSSA